MVDSLGWVNAVAGEPEYSGRMLRQLNAVGFAGATAVRPLGARSGVRPGTSATTVTATSTTWTCQPFAGLCDGQVAGEAGPYPFAFDAVAVGPVTAADGSNPRIDIIYVEVDDPSEDASSVPAVTRKYLAGAAAATPVAPSAPAGCMTVAQISVPKSGGGSPTVTWVAPYVAAAGGTVDFNTKAQLDLWLTAAKGQRARVLATGAEYVSDGAGVWFQGAVSHIQLDTTNSTVSGMATQYGMGRITGAAAVSITEAITFPLPFASVPFIGGSPYIGARMAGAWNPVGLIDINVPTVGKFFTPSTTGLNVLVHRTDGANLNLGWDYYYSWSATGVLA